MSRGRSHSLAPMVLAACLVSLALAALAAPAVAVSPTPKTFAQLVDEAELIVVGTIERIDGVRLATGPIVSDMTLTAPRVVKALRPAPAPLVVRVLGGTVGGVSMVIPGAPEFRVGETVLLFVRGNFADMFPFVGVQAGVFSVRRDDALGVDRVFDWKGRPVVGIRDGAVAIDAGAANSSAVPLDDFLQAVARAARG